MLLPSIFNDNVFDDFMDGFDSFMDRSALYGKHGKNLMKTDVRDVVTIMNSIWICRASRRMKSMQNSKMAI